MAILTLPGVPDLAAFSGRPEGSYTSFANGAILQAVILFQTVTELQPADMAGLSPEDSQLAQFGILSMADYIYLRQPYQAAVASPFITENVGSYSYSKAQQEVARNAAALEVTGEATGVVMYDMAVRMLAKRTRAGGVFFGQVEVFERGEQTIEPSGAQLLVRDKDGALVIVGPQDRDKIDFPLDWNSQAFPQDPGI